MMDIAFIMAGIDVGFDIDQLAMFDRLVGRARAGGAEAAEIDAMVPAYTTGGRPMSTRATVSVVVVTAATALLGIGMCSSGHESTKPVSLPAKPKSTPHERFMPGDGAYDMGGLGGRIWGVWQATAPGPRSCSWSIRSFSRYGGANVLHTGEAAPGAPVQVDIEPDGGVGDSGMIGDHHIMFQTSGCGAWKLTS